MNFLNKMERKFGKYAIPNLMLYIVFANAVVYIADMLSSGQLSTALALYAPYVFRGQIWRIITFIAIPPGSSPIFIIFVLYFYYFIGNALEAQWGSFKFNVYYFTGMLCIIAATLIFSLLGFSIIGSATYLNLTLFFAFAALYPEHQILLFFIIPIKIKYMAYLSAAILALSLVFGSASMRISIIAGVANFLLFFGKDFIHKGIHGPRQRSRRVNYAKKSKRDSDKPVHRCTVCGITEKDDPNMEFRYCSECDGYHEYCMKHLHNHVHIKH